MTSRAQNTAQSTQSPPLKIEWQPIQNDYQQNNRSLATLTITNISKQKFKATGWIIYFNRGSDFPQPDNNGLTVSFINGDLFQLKPNNDFQELPPGKSIIYNLVEDRNIYNFSEGPRGFYLVWNDKPTQAIPLIEKQIAPDSLFLKSKIAGITINWSDPYIIYNKNLSITDIDESQLPKIFPTPLEYNEVAGAFKLSGQTQIFSDPSFSKEANYLSDELGKVLMIKPKIASKQNIQSIAINKGQTNEEGYSLQVTPSEIVITAATGKGVFYAIQSLKTLLPPLSWKAKQPAINIPAVEVTDEPRFGYRSFFLDVARNFQTKDEIFKILDLMSFYKLNIFHFHLTEDEGWRIEIPGLPELTDIGSQRGHTTDNKKNLPPSFASGGLANKYPGSGYYSVKDFIEILRYANDRYIQVIPEIESPGHARAAIKSMEARYAKFVKEGKAEEAKKYLLSDFEDTSKYSSAQNWNDNVMNVTLPSVYTFMEKVSDELIAMYRKANVPLTTIHFGGDEVPAGVWEGSTIVQQFASKNPSIKNTGDLWYYYYGKLNKILKSKGLFMSGWEEIGMRKTTLDGKPYYIPNPDFVNDHFQLHVWNNTIGSGNEDLAYRLANAGYKVVLSNVSNQYFDLAYNNSYNENGQNWGGYVDIDKPFYFIPFDFLKNVKEDGKGNSLENVDRTGKIRLTDYGKANIVGIEGLLWSENNINTDRLEYMLLPKLLGLAERAWAKDPDWALEADSLKQARLYNKAWSQFVNVTGKHELPRLSYYNGGYNYRIPPPGIKQENGSILANSEFPGLQLRYTITGKDPNATSPEYTKPITAKGTIRIAAFDVAGRHGEVMQMENK
ncbi:MAG: family 20 glycosylhydrolase [Ginsengibacter sp.]